MIWLVIVVGQVNPFNVNITRSAPRRLVQLIIVIQLLITMLENIIIFNFSYFWINIVVLRDIMLVFFFAAREVETIYLLNT